MALRLAILLVSARIHAFAPAVRPPLAAHARSTRSTHLNAVPSVQKRGGDAMILTALSVWQALLRAPWATDPDAYLTVDFEGAVIRGSRLALCLYIAEKVFKALRAPESVREVPVPVEAAAVAAGAEELEPVLVEGAVLRHLVLCASCGRCGACAGLA